MYGRVLWIVYHKHVLIHYYWLLMRKRGREGWLEAKWSVQCDVIVPGFWLGRGYIY